jgi:hypothetical protein
MLKTNGGASHFWAAVAGSASRAIDDLPDRQRK